MTRNTGRLLTAALACILVLSLALAGCGSSSGSGTGTGSGKPTFMSFKPTFMSFIGNGSTSAESMKPVVEKLKAQFAGKVVFVDVDMDTPAGQATVKKYKVTMNPTFIILNTKGQVKETFMGAADEQMLSGSLQSFIPGAAAPQSTTPGGTAPQTMPGSAIETIPVNPGTGPQ